MKKGQLSDNTLAGMSNLKNSRIHYVNMVFIPTHFHPHQGKIELCIIIKTVNGNERSSTSYFYG